MLSVNGAPTVRAHAWVARCRRRVALTVIAASVLSATPVWADAETQACIDEHANGQVARAQGALLRAKRLFLACASRECPQLIRDDCATLGSEVEAALPSVVVIAETLSGKDVPTATVRVDDGSESLPVDGRAIFVDPGPHEFRVATPAGAETRVTTLAREAEKYRRVVARFADPLPPKAEKQPAPSAARVPPLAYVAGTVALVATGLGTYFELKGLSQQNTLDGCKPNCQQADVDAMRRSYLMGDIFLGVALVSFGTGAYVLLRQSSGPRSPKTVLSISPGPGLLGFGVRSVTEF